MLRGLWRQFRGQANPVPAQPQPKQPENSSSPAGNGASNHSVNGESKENGHQNGHEEKHANGASNSTASVNSNAPAPLAPNQPSASLYTKMTSYLPSLPKFSNPMNQMGNLSGMASNAINYTASLIAVPDEEFANSNFGSLENTVTSPVVDKSAKANNIDAEVKENGPANGHEVKQENLDSSSAAPSDSNAPAPIVPSQPTASLYTRMTHKITSYMPETFNPVTLASNAAWNALEYAERAIDGGPDNVRLQFISPPRELELPNNPNETQVAETKDQTNSNADTPLNEDIETKYDDNKASTGETPAAISLSTPAPSQTSEPAPSLFTRIVNKLPDPLPIETIERIENAFENYFNGEDETDGVKNTAALTSSKEETMKDSKDDAVPAEDKAKEIKSQTTAPVLPLKPSSSPVPLKKEEKTAVISASTTNTKNTNPPSQVPAIGWLDWLGNGVNWLVGDDESTKELKAAAAPVLISPAKPLVLKEEKKEEKKQDLQSQSVLPVSSSSLTNSVSNPAAQGGDYLSTVEDGTKFVADKFRAWSGMTNPAANPPSPAPAASWSDWVGKGVNWIVGDDESTKKLKAAAAPVSKSSAKPPVINKEKKQDQPSVLPASSSSLTNSVSKPAPQSDDNLSKVEGTAKYYADKIRSWTGITDPAVKPAGLNEEKKYDVAPVLAASAQPGNVNNPAQSGGFLNYAKGYLNQFTDWAMADSGPVKQAARAILAQPDPAGTVLKGERKDDSGREVKVNGSSSASMPQEQGAEVIRRLATSVGNAETWLRQQMKEFLDEDVYRKAVENGPRNEHGRYTHVTKDTKDPLFYYLHVLNLLISLRQVLPPFADVQETYLSLVRANPNLAGKLFAAAKTFLLSQEGSDINYKINFLDVALGHVIGDFNTLELDTLPARLPGIQQVVDMLSGMSFVQKSKEQFAANPFAISYRNNGDHWRELVGLPRLNELKANGKTYMRSKKGLILGQAKRLNEENIKEEAKKMLKDFPARVDGMQTALLEILKDLSGDDVTPEVKKDFEKAAATIKKILAAMQDFLGREFNWKNIFNFAYKVFPMIKGLIASLPQSYAAVDKLLRERVMVTLGQFNLIIQDCYLYVDRMESKLYLKDGYLLSIGQGKRGCGLLWSDRSPMDPTSFEAINKLLGDAPDAYLVFGDQFYYVGRMDDGQLWVEPLEIKPHNVVVSKKPLIKLLEPKASGDESNELEPQILLKNADADYLKEKLGIPTDEGFKHKNGYLIPKLNSGHLQYIRSLTGHERDEDSYDDFDFSLNNMGKKFNQMIEDFGYQVPKEQCWPYDHERVKQSQQALVEHQTKLAAADPKVTGDEANPEMIKLRHLTKLATTKAKQAADRISQEDQKNLKLKQDLAQEKNRIWKLQIDARISKLQEECRTLEGRWTHLICEIFTLTRVKQEKIEVLRELKAELIRRVEAGEEVPRVDVAIRTLEGAGQNVDHLHDGLTGKMVKTLCALTLTPQGRIELIDKEIQRLGREIVQDQKYLFFSEWRNQRRRNQLQDRIQALGKFREWMEKPGFRMQECLDHIKAKSGSQFKVLSQETELLDVLRQSDQLRPNFDVGKKNIRFFPAAPVKAAPQPKAPEAAKPREAVVISPSVISLTS